MDAELEDRPQVSEASTPLGAACLPVIDLAIERLGRLAQTHAALLDAAAELFAERIRQGGLIHVFGAGHSHMLAEELFFRAGGLLSFNALLDPALMLHESAVAASELERIPDYAAILLAKYPLAAADALLVISYSGIYPVPVEVARLAKARGLPVVALTSVEASRGSPARHPSGQRLYDVADIVLDNPCPVGDASLHLPGAETSICALSTIVGAAIVSHSSMPQPWLCRLVAICCRSCAAATCPTATRSTHNSCPSTAIVCVICRRSSGPAGSLKDWLSVILRIDWEQCT